MTPSQSLLRSAALSVFTVSLVCNTAEAQLFRRSGDDQTAANERAKQSNTRDGRPAVDPRQLVDPRQAVTPRQPGTQNNPANARTQPNRGAPNTTNRNIGPNAQANTNAQANINGQATRQNNPQNKVGSGLVDRPATQSQPQTSGNSRPQNSNAPAVPRNSLSNQGRPIPQANNLAIPQPPAFFGHQPVSQPSHAQSQSAQALNTQSQRQQSPVTNNNSGLLVAKDGTATNPSAVDGVVNLEGSSNVSETEIFNRFGVQLNDEGDAVWVTNLTASGNGQSAGLNRKDKIVSLGGAPLTSKAEFVEIAKLLSVGDQIEIEFERNGKTEKSLILYGQSSKDQINAEASIQLEDNNNWSTTPTDPRERLERLVAEQQRVIAELQNRIRQLESQSKTAF